MALFVLVLFVHEDDFDAFSKGAKDLVCTQNAADYDAREDACVEVGRVHFKQCPSCDGTKRVRQVEWGVESSGSCPLCQGIRWVQPD